MGGLMYCYPVLEGRTETVILQLIYLEDKLKENVRDNLYSPLILANVCKKLGIFFTYLGTGCIYEGDVETAFKEDDDPNFFGSSYSTVKAYTNLLMSKLYPEFLHLRIRMPITEYNNPRNFITKICSYKKGY